MKEKKQNYTREELIEILDELSVFLSWLNFYMERPHMTTEEEYRKIIDLAESQKPKFSRILSSEYWDSPITVIAISIYLQTGQAQTVEQAVALYKKDAPYAPFT